ncbi:MAG: ketol-acid reductoisomerase [Candidatus Oxydemutatoraceae bacterium WSBS_2016_MAG_OTU14]
MKIFYDNDADLSIIRGKKVTILGFGSQGHAHAANLRDSGVDVTVGLREGSSSIPKVEAEKLKHLPMAEAVKGADVVMMLVPDEHHTQTYNECVESNLKQGGILGFAHGFNIHFKKVLPRPDLDVIMIAPKGPGHLVRSTYLKDQGVPTLIAVEQDASNMAHATALSYASANGGGRAAIIETTFKEEAETDLFGEQAVLCGGLASLIQAGYDTLVEAGYAKEMAYFECLHEMKLIIDLIYEGGIANMNYSISNTAEYGGMTRGNRIIGDAARVEMKKILEEITSGKFADEFVNEFKTGAKNLEAGRKALRESPIEEVGSNLRSMMKWISQEKLVDKSRN